ncbi:MAG TPA: CHAT domain-containing tetratricopeptide repeat protein [Thermoanaerobaculia bacterium]|nr:CHAT domain-containing tetratricopeptide repeat protein [Thermoanaerobaculia bacterium]
MRTGRPALLLLAALFLASAAVDETAQDGETLPVGQRRERPITGGEAHVYHVAVADDPLLVTVEQRGLDLVVEAAGPVAAVSVDAGDHGWGSELLLLEDAGVYRLEVRPQERLVGQARYAIGAEAVPASPPEVRAAFSLMSQAGREAFARTPEARRRAIALYREAQAAWRSLGERRWEAEALYAVAVLEKDLSELPPAVADYRLALALWRELDEPYLEAATLTGLGVAHSAMGESDRAGEDLRNALALWQRLDEGYEEAVTRSNLCYLDQIGGALPAALVCYEEERARFRELGYGNQEARMLNLLGGVYDLQGEPDAALGSYRQALALVRQAGDRLEEARILNNIAVVHRALGEWQEALRIYGQVGEILAPLGDPSLKGILLTNLGFAYNSLGEPRRALALLTEGLERLRETGDRRREIIALNNLGSAWLNLGAPDQAIDHHQRALERAVALGDPRQQAISRLRLAEAQLEKRNAAAALRELGDPGLDYFRTTGNRRNEAQVLDLRGRALTLAGRPQEAMPVLQSALDLHRTLRDWAGEAEALRALAATERSLGRLDLARSHADEAVARVEELRTGFVSPGLRASFLATQRRAWALVIDLLMDRHAAEPGAGHDRAAFEASERARARSLLDVLRSGGTGRAASTVPAGLRERRQTLRRRLSAKADQQLKQAGAPAEALGREMEALLAELDGVEAEVRRLDPHYAAVAAPPTLGTAEIARLLDPETLLLEYSLGEDRSYLWVIGAGSWRSLVLPPEREIEALARRLYEELSTPEAGAGRRREAAEALSRILLGPVWSEAARGRRLVVVPDGALHLLPFGALPVPGSGEPLLARLEIAYLPSATTLALQRQRLESRLPAAKWAAVLADPVFAPEDPRLTGTATAGRRAAGTAARSAPPGAPLAGLERLPATRREAETIAALAPAGQVWTALNLDASREAVLAGGLRGYRVVHFATHGLADTQNPELSGLVLSLVDAAGRPRQGLLSLSDVYELDLDADLVVLSGCRTALGKEVRGEGVMGLTRGFLSAGVPRVVASLWQVQDRTTAELMTRFYGALWRDGLPPAAALRAAQQSLRRDPRYRDPYSWAGFVLQGDWR